MARTWTASSSLTMSRVPRCVDVVTQNGSSARPFALAACRSDFVACPFADDLPFELGKVEQDVQYQPPHRTCRIELLRDRDEGDLVLVEPLHQAGEVEERSAQAVHLVDHHAVDQTRFDVGNQSLQGRAVQVTAGEAAVVVGLGKAGPAFVGLALDERLGGLPLGVERVELLLEARLGRFAGVDGAADRWAAWVALVGLRVMLYRSWC